MAKTLYGWQRPENRLEKNQSKCIIFTQTSDKKKYFQTLMITSNESATSSAIMEILMTFFLLHEVKTFFFLFVQISPQRY